MYGGGGNMDGYSNGGDYGDIDSGHDGTGFGASLFDKILNAEFWSRDGFWRNSDNGYGDSRSGSGS